MAHPAVGAISRGPAWLSAATAKGANGASRATWGTNTIDTTNDDCNGHGTHVAGIAAGKTVGLARYKKLVAVKVLACDGYGSTTSIIKGLEWAVKDAPASGGQTVKTVINMSLGGPVDTAVDQAVQTAVEAGYTVVVSAGNDEQDACNSSPARAPGSFTVAATTPGDGKMPWSNYGPCVDLFAPGEDILSADYQNDGKFKLSSGTSMAAPFVAAAAILLEFGAGQVATPAAVREALIANSTKNKLDGIKTGSPNRLLYAGRKSRPSCTPPSATVTQAGAPYAPLNEKWYNLAHENRAWTGADGTYSISSIPGTGRLWIFSDTFLAPVNSDDTRPETAPFINNSIVQDTSAGAVTHTGGTAQSPSSIMPGTQTYWFWGGAPSHSKNGGDDQLQVVYQEYTRFGTACGTGDGPGTSWPPSTPMTWVIPSTCRCCPRPRAWPGARPS
ncbi:hypothetical protein GCM10022419_129860 [Nonomuraea rosea]|uniref:Peptidase S8/S53 domain-containing protein n=1 Tax=Nonomuraea rosea TaxID=638574 RepID=A0ABP7A0F9_9ACTN